MTATKKLSDNSLNFVSGGTKAETSDDSKFLNSLLYHRLYQCDRYGEYRVSCGDHDQEITKAWESVGIVPVLNSGNLVSQGDSNTYWLNGRQLTQEQARQHAMDVTGVYLTRAQWDW